MMTLDFGGRLQALAVGIVGTNLFGETMPATPDQLVALYDTTGFEPIRAMSRVALEVRNLQAIARAVKPSLAEDLANDVFVALDRFDGVLGVHHYTVLARHHPFSIGVDENKRSKWTCNYQVWRRAV